MSCQFKTAPTLIEVVGEAYTWHIRYAGKDGKLHTADDVLEEGDIYAPENRAVQISLSSRDNLYFLFLNEFQQKGLALIDREELLLFETGQEGSFPIVADQMCGFSHESLHIQFHVIGQEEFAKRYDGKY